MNYSGKPFLFNEPTLTLRSTVGLNVLYLNDLQRRPYYLLTLGAKGHLPRGYIEDTLRFFKQFTQKVSRGYMLSSFTMYPPL